MTAPLKREGDQADHEHDQRARFQNEVVAAPDVIAAHIERARESVSDAFRHIFARSSSMPTGG